MEIQQKRRKENHNGSWAATLPIFFKRQTLFGALGVPPLASRVATRRYLALPLHAIHVRKIRTS